MNQDMDVDDVAVNNDEDDGVPVPFNAEATAPAEVGGATSFSLPENESVDNTPADDGTLEEESSAAGDEAPLLPPPSLLVAVAAEKVENEIGGVNNTAADDGALEEESSAAVDEGDPSKKRKPDQELGAPPKKKAPAASPKNFKSPVKRVAKTTLHFKSDVALDDHATHPSGILHATRGAFVSPHQPGGPREDHAFAWIEGNANDPAVVHAAAGYFMARGFRASQMRFIPFSSREGWEGRYPHGAPCVSCDDTGEITDCRPPPPLGGGDDGPAPKKKKARKKTPPKLLARGRLPDSERDELHLEIYKYLSWLHDELAEMETSPKGRRQVTGTGTHVPGLRSLVTKMEGTFRAVQVAEKERAAQEAADAEFKDSCSKIGGDSTMREFPPSQAAEAAAGPNFLETTLAEIGGDNTKEQQQNKRADMPFLETRLEMELQQMVVDKKAGNSNSTKEGGEATADGRVVGSYERRAKHAAWRKVDFETMYQKLVRFKEEEGHVSPPVKHPELGRFVSELRMKKRILREKGLDHEPEDAENTAEAPGTEGEREPGIEGERNDANNTAAEAPGAEGAREGERIDANSTAALLGDEENPDGTPAVAAAEGELTPKKDANSTAALLGDEENPDGTPAEAAGEGELTPKKDARLVDPRSTNTFLTRSRVQLLDSIDFVWRSMTERYTWEQRLEQLRLFKEEHRRWPKGRDGTIGNWLKNQKKLYTKKDADFMANMCPKMEAMGVPLRQRNFTPLSWEDRFQQLVEFGRVNRHFNVPNPAPDNGEGRAKLQDQSSGVAEANRFYKFVQKIHTEHRALRRGVPSTMLTEDRISQLGLIGFKFSTKVEKEVPVVDWNTRLQHLMAFRTEMGHLRVDPNYDKYSNIGGWALDMSEMHRRWQEGKELADPAMIDKFNQLTEMGFAFDIFPVRRGERSWEVSYELLLKYKEEKGSTRVPHHYKADFRLGSWVAVQRKEYKLLMDNKPSKITREKVERLDAVGFEWVVRKKEPITTLIPNLARDI